MKLKKVSCVFVLVLSLSFSVVASFAIKVSSKLDMASNIQTYAYEISTEHDYSEGYVSEWNYTYNPSPYPEEAFDVGVDSKNNIIAVGFGQNVSYPQDNYWNVMKLDKDGGYLWNYTYDSGILNSDDRAVSVAVDSSDDSFVVAGYNRNLSASNDYEWRIIKFSSANNKLWEVVYNITPGDDKPTGVAIDHEKNIIVIGYYNASTDTLIDLGWYILKLHGEDGNQIWNKTLNFSNNDDRATGVAIDIDNNITVVGFDRAWGSTDAQWRIIKLDKNNNTLWNYNENFSPYDDQPTDVAVDKSNNIIAVGMDRFQGQYDTQWRVMKFNKDSKSLWNYTNDASPTTDVARGVTIDSLNSILVVGYFNASTTYIDNDWLIMKFRYDKVSLWNYTEKPSSYNDQARSVVADRSDDIIVVGSDSLPSINDLQWRVMKFRSLSSRVHNINTGLNYATIQEAINANETLDGHTIQVDTGTYYENIDVNKAVSLIGENKETTIIDGGGVGNVAKVTADNCTITGCTIRNAKGGWFSIVIDHVNNCNISWNIITHNWAGIYLGESSNNTIVGNNITENEYNGIELSGSNNSIAGNNITNNSNKAVLLYQPSNYNSIVGNNITNNGDGIILSKSSNNHISGNNITENSNFGVYLWGSSNNTLRNNGMANNTYNFYVSGENPLDFTNNVDSSNTVDGKLVYYWINESDKAIPLDAGYVALVNCTRITVQNLNLTKNGRGVLMAYTINSTITNNNITNELGGVWIYSSSNNSIVGNNVSNYDGDGIYLWKSSNNTISENNIMDSNITLNNDAGIYLRQSSNNHIVRNMFTNSGLVAHYSYGNIVEGNVVNGKPLVYLEGVSDCVVDDAGQVILVNCNNMQVESHNLSNTSVGLELWGTNNSKIANDNITNNYYGISLYYSSNNTIVENSVTDNYFGIWLYESANYNSIVRNNITESDYYGIYLHKSSNNTMVRNNIANNEEYGISVWGGSSENKIFHNNFANNTHHTYVDSVGNIWDNGAEGNYWDDYNSTDLYSGPYQNETGRDGIGDSWYEIDENNTDHYPLKGMFSDFTATLENHIQTICNSTISGFQFNGTAIRFNVTGENGTTGFCRICIPTALMNDTFTVYVDGVNTTYSLLPCSNTTHSYLYFTYNHSTQEVIIIPEFPSLIILPLFMIATLLAVKVHRRKHPNTHR